MLFLSLLSISRHFPLYFLSSSSIFLFLISISHHLPFPLLHFSSSSFSSSPFLIIFLFLFLISISHHLPFLLPYLYFSSSSFSSSSSLFLLIFLLLFLFPISRGAVTGFRGCHQGCFEVLESTCVPCQLSIYWI